MFYILFTYFISLFSVIYIGLSIRYTKQCKQRQQIGDTSHDCKFDSCQSGLNTEPADPPTGCFWIDFCYNCTWASVRNSPPRGSAWTWSCWVWRGWFLAEL